MRARLVPFEGDVTPTPEAQVGFRLDGEDQFNYLTERELTPERVAPYSHSTRLVEIKLISARGAGFTELLRRLSLLGIQFEERYRSFDQGMEEPGETIKIQYDFEIDNDLLRAVSKIGFNYAAFVLGADAVRSKEFDAARDFIRRGKRSSHLLACITSLFLTDPMRKAFIRAACSGVTTSA